MLSQSSADGGVRSWSTFINKWTELDDTVSDIVDADIGKFVAVNSSKILDFVANVTNAYASDTPLASPSQGALWLNTVDGNTYSWYRNTTGNEPYAGQWLKA